MPCFPMQPTPGPPTYLTCASFCALPRGELREQVACTSEGCVQGEKGNKTIQAVVRGHPSHVEHCKRAHPPLSLFLIGGGFGSCYVPAGGVF